MICADSSSFVAFVKGEMEPDVELVAQALAHHQSCLDHDVPLITRDQDFQAFQKLVGLRLL